MDQPFLMPVEDVFGIKGRGTVVTGRIERGRGQDRGEVEIVGMGEPTRKMVVTGVEMFKKTLDQGQAGDNVGCLLRGDRAGGHRAGAGAGQAGQSIKPHTKFAARGVRADQGGGGAAHAVLQRVPAAVLHPDHGRDGGDRAARRGWRW